MKFAVIVPVYNQERYLIASLDSALAAAACAKCAVSVVCVDDGSTDGTARLLAEYAAGHAEVVVVRQENVGVSAARNRGLDLALADPEVTHVMFLDPDDCYAPDIFAKVIPVVEGADIVQFGFEAVDEEGRFLRRLRNVGTNVWSRCFRRETIGGVRFFTGASVAEDIAFNLEIAFRARPRVVSIGDSLYRYRQSSSSEMHRRLAAKDFSERVALLEYLVSVHSGDPVALDGFARTDLFDLLKQFYRQLPRVSAAEAREAEGFFRSECAALRRRGLLHPRRGRLSDFKYFLRFVWFGWHVRCDKPLSRRLLTAGFANVLHAAEESFGGEVRKLALGLDVGDAVVSELCWLDRFSQEDCDGWVSSLDAEGLWPDIDYASANASNWEAVTHLRRLVALARQPRTEAIVAACHKGLAGWLRDERVNRNWWWNEIGCPKELGVFALLFDKELTRRERAAVVGRLSVARLARTGQNRIWLAEGMLLRGLVEGNRKTIRIAKNALIDEIVMCDGEVGIQSDWSFHQHGKMPQFGNYGIAYLLVLSRWAAVFADAGEKFGEEKLRILGAFLENGLKSVVWQGRMDVGALGRQFCKDGMRIKGLSVEVAEHYLRLAGWKPESESVRTGLSFYDKSAMAVDCVV